MYRPRGRRHAVSALVVLLAGLAQLASGYPVDASTPLVSMTLKPSVATAIDGTPVTWIATIKPERGTPSGLQLSMDSLWHQISVGSSFVVAGGSCEPAGMCTVDERTGNPTWQIPSLTSQLTLKYHTLARSGSLTTLRLEAGDAGCSGTCPASARITVPSASAKVSVAPQSSPILPGTILRVTISGSATAGPMEGLLQARLSAGLSAPTAITPASAAYAPPPSHYLDSPTTLDKTGSLTFDVEVTGAIGTTIEIAGHFYPNNAKYPTTASTVKLKVGAALPTPTPRATPKPSAKASSPPSATPPTAAPTAEPTASPTPEATTTPVATEPSPSPEPTPSPEVAPTASPSNAPEPTSAPEADPVAAPASAAWLVAALVVAGGASVGVGALARRRRR